MFFQNDELSQLEEKVASLYNGRYSKRYKKDKIITISSLLRISVDETTKIVEKLERMGIVHKYDSTKVKESLKAAVYPSQVAEQNGITYNEVYDVLESMTENEKILRKRKILRDLCSEINPRSGLGNYIEGEDDIQRIEWGYIIEHKDFYGMDLIILVDICFLLGIDENVCIGVLKENESVKIRSFCKEKTKRIELEVKNLRIRDAYKKSKQGGKPLSYETLGKQFCVNTKYLEVLLGLEERER